MQAKLSDSAELPAYAQLGVATLLELIGRPAPTPAAGTVASVAAALASALCIKCASLSTKQLADASRYQQRGIELQTRAIGLAQADAEAYNQVIFARRLRHEPQSGEQAAPSIDEAMRRVIGTPIEIARLGVEIGRLAVELAELGNPNLVGDAVTAALLADSAVQAAVTLANINLAAYPTDQDVATLDMLITQSKASVASAQARAAQHTDPANP
jgi:formiminotetrahydrofolate cyclodeaminase